MRKRFLLGVTIFSALAIGATAIAHEVQHDSKVTVRYQKANDQFAGKVVARKQRCEQARTVRIIRVEEDGKTRVATGTTDDAGSYAIPYEVAETGKYFARVTREVLRRNQKHKHVCAADRSATINVAAPPAR